MTKKRATKTIRLDATIINAQPESTRLDERFLSAPKPTLADLPAAELLNTLRETGGRDGEALLELQARYDRSIERKLQKYDIRDWLDRQSITNEIWEKVVRVTLIPQDSRGAWNPSRSRHSTDPFQPLLSRIIRSKAIDFHRKAKRQKTRFTAYTEDLARFGDDVADLAETRRPARRRLLECVNPSKAPPPITGPLTRRLAAAARPEVAAAVAELPERLKRPLVLHSTGGTCATISEKEGISPGEVSKRMQKARERLRDRFSPPEKVG
jgi:RNA polymerase sigma factor (sigma-70 family)